MKITTSTVTKLNISEVKDLDPITVVLDDIAPRCGKIMIECWGESWAAQWNGMGTDTIAEFFSTAYNDYLIGNLAPNLEKRIYDPEQNEAWLKTGLIEKRKERTFSKEEARELWEEIQDHEVNNEHYFHTCSGADMAAKCINQDWYFELPQTINHKWDYLSNIVHVVKAALAKAKGGVA